MKSISVPDRNSLGLDAIRLHLGVLTQSERIKLARSLDSAIETIYSQGVERFKGFQLLEGAPIPDAEIDAVNWGLLLTPPFDFAQLELGRWTLDLLLLLDERV